MKAPVSGFSCTDFLFLNEKLPFTERAVFVY